MSKTITKRLISWSKGGKKGPVKLQINPTDRCNLKCVFCWQRDESKVNYENEVSDERYYKLITEAKELGVEFVEITGGGEPTFRKELTLTLIEKIKESKMRGSMITNGTLLTKKDLTRIVKTGWDEIIFSLDGLKKNHDYLRGVDGAFEKTIKNISLLQEIKKQEKSQFPKICVHFVLTKLNYEDIPALIEKIALIGVKNFFIEPLVQVAFNIDIGERLKIKKEHYIKLNKILKQASKICERYSIENNIGDFSKKDLIKNTNKMNEFISLNFLKKKTKHTLLNFPCYEPWHTIVIRPNGRVGPCCMFDYSGVFIHDLSLKEIWFGEYFTKTRKDLSEGKLKGFCAQCNPSQIASTIKIKNELEKEFKK